MTFITSGASVRKAGTAVSGAITEAAWNEWISGAEAQINVETRYNWNDAYGTLNGDLKGLLADTGAAMVAMNAVIFDMNSYPSRIDAETRLDVLRDQIVRNLNTLEDVKKRDFLIGA